MTTRIRDQFTSVVCIYLLIVTPTLIPGCPEGVPALISTLTLSASSANPGEIITVYSDALVAGETAQAVLRSSSGYEVSLELVNIQNGSGQIMVPPYMDTATGAFQAGQVSVSIGGAGAEAALNIGGLPDAGDLTPGAMLQAVLESAIASYQDLANNMTIMELAEEAVDATAALAQVNTQITTLQAMVDELATGQLTVTVNGETVVLGADELAVADQILLALFSGFGTGSATAKPLASHRDIAECLKLGEQQLIVDCLGEVVDDVRASTGVGTNLSSMLATGVGLVFLVGGIVFASEAVAVTGLIVTVAGAASSFTNAAVNEQNTDAFLNNDGEGFNATTETASQTTRILTSAATALPGGAGLVAQAGSAGLGAKDLIEGARSARCSSSDNRNRQTLPEVEEFCRVTSLDGGSGDDGTGDGGSGDDGGGDDGGTPGTFTVLNYLNVDGTLGSGAAGAEISLSGSAGAPTISWSFSNAFSVVVTSGTVVMYGIYGERTDSEGDVEQVPFGFSSITYGDYSQTDTVLIGGAPSPALSLQSGVLYSITMGTLDGQTAVLNFMLSQ